MFIWSKFNNFVWSTNGVGQYHGPLAPAFSTIKFIRKRGKREKLKNRKSGYLQILENEQIFPFGFIFLEYVFIMGKNCNELYF